MKIQPNPSGRSSGAPDRITRGASRGAERAHPSGGEPRGEGNSDEVRISPEARDLSPLSATASESSLSGVRLREVLDRVADGFYERPEVVDTVLRRLRKDL